jgi:hypothetical protein
MSASSSGMRSMLSSRLGATFENGLNVSFFSSNARGPEPIDFSADARALQPLRFKMRHKLAAIVARAIL